MTHDELKLAAEKERTVLATYHRLQTLLKAREKAESNGRSQFTLKTDTDYQESHAIVLFYCMSKAQLIALIDRELAHLDSEIAKL